MEVALRPSTRRDRRLGHRRRGGRRSPAPFSGRRPRGRLLYLATLSTRSSPQQPEVKEAPQLRMSSLGAHCPQQTLDARSADALSFLPGTPTSLTATPRTSATPSCWRAPEPFEK